ncbi:MAG TPA: hypothetical protein VKR42_00530, partial [Ktedonobacteraceae bacterium]|nr:hypothetical protein [Ktedonobacteraceae bacterium]
SPKNGEIDGVETTLSRLHQFPRFWGTIYAELFKIHAGFSLNSGRRIITGPGYDMMERMRDVYARKRQGGYTPCVKD